MNWTKYFDAIWCIDYKPMKLRKQLILKQFERVGILNHPNFKFHQTFSSPFDNMLYQKMVQSGKIIKQYQYNQQIMNASLGHYACTKKSLIDNYNRILIIENDIRFLKDINKIQEYLNNLPNDYDIILFDYFQHCSNQEFEQYKNKHKINNFFAQYINLSSAGCYSLSNKGMKIFSQLYETKFCASDVLLAKIDLSNLLKKCFTIKPLACQVTFSNCLNCRGKQYNVIHNVYKKNNLDYNNYNMNEGKPYNYGDYINE